MSTVAAALETPARPLGKYAARYPALALLIAVPCFWQPHIQANDLSSHLYNAWLTNQVPAGQLPGLYLVPQFTNVLFDELLSLLLRTGSVTVAEHVAVLLSVQIFFWGCFALASTVAKRPAWGMAPFLAMLAYGSVFRLGFFNFYISTGICVWAIAVVWQDRARLRLLAVPLFLLAWSAHYLPCLWALALLGYVAAARSLGPRRIWWLLAGGVAALCALAAWIAYRVPSRWIAGTRIDSMFGVDQVMPFGSKYAAVAMGLLCLWIYLLVRRFEEKPRLPDEPVLQLWILGAAACLVLPDSIWIPLYTGGLRFITIRLSMMSAVLFCAVLAPVRLRIAETLIATGLLALFLALSFSDERALNTVEQQVAQAAATLPTGARVVATLKNPKLYIQALTHIADRPCIGRCFDVGNYEATTGQFRLRARPGNTYLIGDHDAMGDLEADRFVFRRSDFDLYQFSACADGNSICVSRVRPGERLVKRNIALSAW